MKVILISEIEKIGKFGDILEVKNGFARNYLLPKNLALEYSPHNLKLVEQKRKKIEAQLKLEKLSAEEQKSKLEAALISFRRKAGENDVLFGSVTTADIAEELEKAGLKIEKKKIHLSEPIKRVGNYSCLVKLHNEVTAELKIEVLPLTE